MILLVLGLEEVQGFQLDVFDLYIYIIIFILYIS